MAQTRSKLPNKKRNSFFNQRSAVAVTLWSQDGAPVSDRVLDDISDTIAYIARQNNLLTQVTKA